jgi:hypothetical protein
MAARRCVTYVNSLPPVRGIVSVQCQVPAPLVGARRPAPARPREGVRPGEGGRARRPAGGEAGAGKAVGGGGKAQGRTVAGIAGKPLRYKANSATAAAAAAITPKAPSPPKAAAPKAPAPSAKPGPVTRTGGQVYRPRVLAGMAGQGRRIGPAHPRDPARRAARPGRGAPAQVPRRGLHPAPGRQGTHPVGRRGRQRPGQAGQPRCRADGHRQAPHLPARRRPGGGPRRGRRPRHQRGGHGQRRVTRGPRERRGRDSSGCRPGRAVCACTCRARSPASLRCRRALPLLPGRPPTARGQVYQGADRHRSPPGTRPGQARYKKGHRK